MNLADLRTGEMAIVDQVLNIGREQGIVQRLAAMGVVSDRPVQVLRKAQFNGPLHIRVGATTEIAIRPHEAEMIVIKTDEDDEINFYQGSQMIPKSVIELMEQVKSISVMILISIILLLISELYQFLNNGNINQANQQKIAANLVPNSTSELTENQTLETVDVDKVAPTIATANNKSASPETTTKATTENTSNQLATTTNSSSETVESIGKKITDKQEIARLQQNLYTDIDNNWKKPVKQTAIYLVKVDKNGVIISYEAFNQIAKNHLSSTPLPNLVKPNNLTNQTEWTEFAILLYEDGNLEIEPK
ncbi:FeoA family protein [Dapis sp. BLCC M229]|uniref:FeoA family protein n=1 Tax=Dapis sp. BLCC M229 TaxID=3400188 RepID=UPI003CF4CF37